MLDILISLLLTGKSLLQTKRELATQNLALRQQLAVLNRTAKRAKLNNVDRVFLDSAQKSLAAMVSSSRYRISISSSIAGAVRLRTLDGEGKLYLEAAF